ncbi:MAG: hypothetical protein JRF47_13820, partial [Deltaproteobacteria bacterium]|nr:hypothetical protein [Deltaproteobacteria bacterium]
MLCWIKAWSDVRVTGYALRVTRCGVRVTGYELRVTGYGVRGTGYGLRVARC